VDKGCNSFISYHFVKHNQSQGDYLTSIPIQKFKIENGIVTNEGWENPDPNVKVIHQRDKDKPHIKIFSPLEDSVYKEGPSFSYEIDEKNPSEMWYSLDDGKTKNGLIKLKGGEILDLDSGNYDLIVYAKDLFGNENSDTVNFSIDKSTGIESKVMNSNLKVYPNPVSDHLYFKTDKEKEAELNIYSINGKEIKKIRDFDGQIEVDMKEYPAGIYLYRYKNSEGVKAGKIIKK
jgi:hypothetical protein